MLKIQVSFLVFLGFFALSLSYKIRTETKEGIPDNLNTDPFVKIGQGLYYIETITKVNWFDANELCHAKDAELITIETIEEWDLINKYLEDNKIEEKYWTSGNDLAKQFDHVWFTTAKSIKLSEIWAPGEPNNYNNSNERCDVLGHRAVPTNKPGLNDSQCSYLYRFICEKRQLKTVSFLVW